MVDRRREFEVYKALETTWSELGMEHTSDWKPKDQAWVDRYTDFASPKDFVVFESTPPLAVEITQLQIHPHQLAQEQFGDLFVDQLRVQLQQELGDAYDEAMIDGIEISGQSRKQLREQDHALIETLVERIARGYRARQVDVYKPLAIDGTHFKVEVRALGEHPWVQARVFYPQTAVLLEETMQHAIQTKNEKFKEYKHGTTARFPEPFRTILLLDTQSQGIRLDYTENFAAFDHIHKDLDLSYIDEIYITEDSLIDGKEVVLPLYNVHASTILTMRKAFLAKFGVEQ